jgi:hypothetical protein
MGNEEDQKGVSEMTLGKGGKRSRKVIGRCPCYGNPYHSQECEQRRNSADSVCVACVDRYLNEPLVA